MNITAANGSTTRGGERMAQEQGTLDVFGAFRQFLALERDVLVLSVAMLAFSLSFQMTNRYLPQYLSVLGAGAGIIGLYGSVGNLISAAYPYPGGALSDRIGSRLALTLFAVLSTLGFGIWLVAPELGALPIGSWSSPRGSGFSSACFSPSRGSRSGSARPLRSSNRTSRPIGLLQGLRAPRRSAGSDFYSGRRWPPGSSPCRRGSSPAFSSSSRLLSCSQRPSPSTSSTTRAATRWGRSSRGLSSLPTFVTSGGTQTVARRGHLRPVRQRMVYAFFVIVFVQFLEVGATLPVGRLAPRRCSGCYSVSRWPLRW